MKAGQRDGGSAGQHLDIGFPPYRRTAVPPYRHTAGFTLVEMLVALVVAGMLALLAHQIFSAAMTGAQRLQSARRTLDRQQVGHRLLTGAFLSMEIGNEGGAFDGRPEQMRFATWLPTEDGWFERAQFFLSVNDGRLVAAFPPGPPVVLIDSVVAGKFDYLLEPGGDARWVEYWESPVSAPLAVRLRIARKRGSGATASDTTVYLIKARG